MNKCVKKLEIKNKLGLHARAAALLVQTVNKFSAQVSVSKDGQTADGRSIMGVLTFGCRPRQQDPSRGKRGGR